MKLNIDWADPLMQYSDPLEIKTMDLEDFYQTQGAYERSNLFFVLEASFRYYAGEGDNVRAAYLAYLAAYYLFVTLTPPGASMLALYYIKQAVQLDPKPEYERWLDSIERED